MKVVYITGCLGFIGSHVTREILKLGWYVRGVDKITYAANPKLLNEFNKYPNFIFEQKDINNLKFLYDCDYVINLAAFTHVDNSIVNSDDFIHSNINGVHNLLELIRKQNHFKMPTLLHFSCYDEKTRALTTDGLKEYNDIKCGDTVISINPNTGMKEFKKVLNVIIQDYNGDMLHFNNKSNDLMVTPNHRMYYTKNNKIQVDTAENMSNSNNLFYIKGRKNGIIENEYFIPGIGNVSIKDLFYVSGVFIGDGIVSHITSVRENISGLSRPEYLKNCRNNNGRFKKMIKSGKNNFSICNSYRIFFDTPENDKARKKLEFALTNLNIKWYAEKNKSGEHIYFSSKEWIAYFNNFGKYAENKTIPNWMFCYDYTILKELYNGLIDSDGYWNKSNTGILTTVSYDLVQKCCLLGECLGFHTEFSSYKQTDILSAFGTRTIKSRKKRYDISFNTKKIKAGNKKYNKIKYSGKIWCLSVEDNKNFVVERNGYLKISGNTDEVYGDIKESKHKETDLLKPSNPYSATKASADMLIIAWARTYSVPYIIVRPTNNYGVGQYTEKLIPKACKFLQLGRKIPLHENGLPIRTWLHAEDTAKAIIQIILNGAVNEIYNISGNYEQSNIDTVLKIIYEYMGFSSILNINNYIDFSITRLGQDVRYAVDDTKLKNLGWKPECIFDEKLKEIVQYYKENFIW